MGLSINTQNKEKQHIGFKTACIFILLLIIIPCFAFAQSKTTKITNHKIIIYQLLPRLFGNKNTTNTYYGSITQNGSGKFNDIDEKALHGIKELSVNYIWFTGIIAHASLTNYTKYGIPNSDADVVKGIAGSPYAIRDYYDVNPDLAVNVNQRMQEFETLINRSHANGLKVLIDFVPNHVARGYRSIAKPINVEDFGANDDTTKSFSPKNDYYYLIGNKFEAPNINKIPSPIDEFKDHKFIESPAKATGNNSFKAKPADDDWYETIKLNYGVDYQNGEKKYFHPIPPVWLKMKDILIFWAQKGVDGFRCDVAEMVPVEFWEWVIPQVKNTKPNLVFIGEAYNQKVYAQYLNQGGFDYLYDKVGLYDALKKLIKNQQDANVKEVSEAKNFVKQIDAHMLRFLENHDEERIASKGFASDASLGLPGMTVSATISNSPLMIYCGQEVGEPGEGVEGFGKNDNRTTIFDYWGIPNHQKWMNNGLFDGAKLSLQQLEIRNFYKKLLKISTQNPAITTGNFAEIPQASLNDKHIYAFVRYSTTQRLLIIANFSRTNTFKTILTLPAKILNGKVVNKPYDILNNKLKEKASKNSIKININPVSSQIIAF